MMWRTETNKGGFSFVGGVSQSSLLTEMLKQTGSPYQLQSGFNRHVFCVYFNKFNKFLRKFNLKIKLSNLVFQCGRHFEEATMLKMTFLVISGWKKGSSSFYSVVNFISILRAALTPIFYCQKNSRSNGSKRKAAERTVIQKSWWNWYPGSISTTFYARLFRQYFCAKKLQSQKLRKALLYEKHARKLMMKSTPARSRSYQTFFFANKEFFRILLVSLHFHYIQKKIIDSKMT